MEALIEFAFVPPFHLEQSIVIAMISIVVNDFESLDYSPETAGATLDALVMISSESKTLESEAQVRVQ